MSVFECRTCGTLTSSNGKPDECSACGGPKGQGPGWYRFDDADELLS